MLLLLLYFILGTSNASQDVINTGGKTIHVFSERGRNDRLDRPNSFILPDLDKNIPGSWPWAVSIGYQDGWNWMHTCDGVIVTNGSVVTSAACLANYEWNEKTVETLSVRAGDNHLKFHGEKIQLANVSRHEKHPGFNASAWPMEHYEDVAVLFLLPSLNFTRSVKPIYIPTLEEGITTTKAKDTDITLTACGWGGKFKVGGRKLQDAVITSLEDNFCNFVYRGDGLSKNLTDEILCAANVIDLSGTCKVGQGSGIFRLYHDPVDHTKNRYVLTGILSSHIKSDGNITCGSPHTPNVFVRVASRSILSFLYKTIYNIESDSSAAAAAAQPSIELDQEPTLDPYYESCGVNNIIDHILDMELSGTNGQQETATWPWLVPLLVNRTTPMNFELICAGTILTEDKILTAAHCFDGIYDEMMIKVRAGDVFLNNAIDDSMVQEVYINKSDVTIHPNYTENRYFDLAILHLRTKFNFTTKVRPVCLLSPQEAATITKNNETLLSILVSGWGRDSLGRYGQDLWQIVAEIFSKAICDNTYRDSSHIRNLLPNLFTEDVLCAGDPAGDSGTCHGDSGGGAVHFDQKRRRYVARAVVSGSKHGQCGSGFSPNIYARLSDAIVNNWIFSQINFTAPTDMVFEDGNYTFVSGNTVTYNCSTTSNPVSQISWTLTDHLNNTLLFQESSSEERFGQNWMKTSRITFVFPRDSDSVEVKCTGKNVMGHLSATAVLSAAPNCTDDLDWTTPCFCGSTMCLSQHIYCLRRSSNEDQHKCLTRRDLRLELQTCGCDVGDMYDGNCYLLVSTPATWQGAQLDCTSRNGSLPSVHNAGTNHFIADLAGGGGSNTWIGASDAETEGEWKWTDGNIATFSNWRRGEPNNAGGNQNCLIINFHETGKWDDIRCDAHRPYVCHGQKLSKGCESGWKQYRDKCYKVFPEVIVTFADASEKCSSVQADVAALETREENEYIKFLLDQEQLPSGRDIWLSGRKQTEDSPYVWGTGEEMVYNDWRGGQPQKRSELCMSIYRNDHPTWQWDTQPCDTRGYPDNGVLCEKTAN